MDNTVESIFREIMEWDETERVSDDMSPDTVEDWDSLVSMELTLRIEKAFSIKFDYGEIIAMETLGDIKRIVRKKIS